MHIMSMAMTHERIGVGTRHCCWIWNMLQ